MSCIVSAFSWYIKLKCGYSEIGNITFGRLRWAGHISEWITLEYRRQVTGWTVPSRKTSGKTTWGELVAGEYKKMEETSRGQVFLEVNYWRGQGKVRAVAPLKKKKKKKKSIIIIIINVIRSAFLTNDIYLLMVTSEVLFSFMTEKIPPDCTVSYPRIP